MQRRNSGESDEDVLLKVDAETEALRGVAGESLKNGETSEAGTHSYSCTTAKKEDAWSTSSREVTPGSTTSPSTTQEAGDMSRTTSSSVEMINSSSCTSGSRRNPIEDLDALGEMQRTLSYGRNIQDTGYDTVSQEELSQRIRKTTESFIDEINSPGRKALSAGVSRTELIDRLARDTREMGHLRGIIDRQADLLQAQLDALIRIREASTHLLSNAEMTGHVEQLERLHLDQKLRSAFIFVHLSRHLGTLLACGILMKYKVHQGAPRKGKIVRIHEAVSHFSSGLRDIEEEYRMWGAEDNAIDSMKTPDTVTAVGQGRQQQELHQGESSSVLRETSDRTEEKMKNSDVGEKK
ncbi:unnamed protein product [Amoebophrya sp. A25]|nr:unnamed protein product [Amoebophrya sp. A25]|eukprot:GSA25T00021905001.1